MAQIVEFHDVKNFAPARIEKTPVGATRVRKCQLDPTGHGLTYIAITGSSEAMAPSSALFWF